MKKIMKLTIDGIDNTGNISDGYHSFDELYEHRSVLFIALCRQLHMEDEIDNQNKMKPIHRVWRSKLHSDGTNYDGWFIMGINQEWGEQITYHLPMRMWEETNFAETLEFAPEFDEHTSATVLKRLRAL